jgi:hypothetical protein
VQISLLRRQAQLFGFGTLFPDHVQPMRRAVFVLERPHPTPLRGAAFSRRREKKKRLNL